MVLFGGREDAESVGIGALETLLNALFDGKLASLESRASGIADELRLEAERFGEACSRFGALDAEPDTEDLYSPNIGFIKGQKALYVKALERIIGELRLAAGPAPNIYERYRLVLSSAEDANTEILRANARFRIVVQCYRKHLAGFKRSSSGFGKLISMMKKELDRKGPELSEYNAAKGQIARLRLRAEELAALEGRGGAPGEGAGPDGSASLDREERDAMSALEGKRAEEAETRSRISGLHAKLAALVNPLERAARKFDHMSAGKTQLRFLLGDPVNGLGDEAGYGTFRTMVKELKEGLDSGKIDVRNGADASRAAERLLGSDVYSMAGSLRLMNDRKLAIEGEVRSLERRLGEIRAYRADIERAAHDREVMQKGAGEARRSLESSKEEVEKLFLRHYGKRIAIML